MGGWILIIYLMNTHKMYLYNFTPPHITQGTNTVAITKYCCIVCRKTLT